MHRDRRAAALDALRRYPWPGNIRELRNVIYQALVYKRAGDELLLSDLLGLIRPASSRPSGRGVRPPASSTGRRWRRRSAAPTSTCAREVAALERAALELALARTGGNAARAARLLGAVGRGRPAIPAAPCAR